MFASTICEVHCHRPAAAAAAYRHGDEMRRFARRGKMYMHAASVINHRATRKTHFKHFFEISVILALIIRQSDADDAEPLTATSTRHRQFGRRFVDVALKLPRHGMHMITFHRRCSETLTPLSYLSVNCFHLYPHILFLVPTPPSESCRHRENVTTERQDKVPLPKTYRNELQLSNFFQRRTNQMSTFLLTEATLQYHSNLDAHTSFSLGINRLLFLHSGFKTSRFDEFIIRSHDQENRCLHHQIEQQRETKAVK
jgi:hypothetical protein